jgi:hypothetical protein
MRSWRDWSWADGNFWDSGVQPQIGRSLHFSRTPETKKPAIAGFFPLKPDS